tara:strand:+ start:2857 stop:3183 length:327 start_codon:yes stop_codon:yes gene_type:complete
MIYATLDEAWAKKPRVKRITQREKNKNIVISNKKYELEKIVLKDPDVVSLLKEIDDPDAYIMELLKQKSTKEVLPKKNVPIATKDVVEKDQDDIIYFLYFLILLVLLY